MGREQLTERREAYRAASAEAISQAKEYNEGIDQLARDFRAGDSESVARFCTLVLDSSAYPDEFPHQTRVIYRPEPREVVVEWELPPQSFIPVERGYKYVATRDAIGLIPSGSAISLVVQANSFLRRPVIVRSGSSTAIYDFEPA